MNTCFSHRTPLSADEVLIAEEMGYLVNRGMPLAKARTWALVNVRQGVSNRPHSVVEYARADKSDSLFGESVDKFYAECRAKSPLSAGAFVGD